MSQQEQMLILILQVAVNPNTQAMLLQEFIQKSGPLSEEAATEVRKILGEKLMKGD